MDPVEEIKDRLSIEDVVGRYVDLKRSGASYKGLCPFHQEKTPSFYVSPSRGTYHCFGCSKGGDAFSFVMEMERLAFPEALRRLADQAGVALPEREAPKPSLSGQLYEANEAAARFFRQALGAEQGARARQYLRERRFGEQAIEMFGLGYAPDTREALVRSLRQAGFDDRILLAAGLALQDEVGGAMRDRFHGRLMFPIRDRAARLVGFGGRTLGESQPKYLNSPQTEIFDKSSVLFGIHLAQDAIRQAGRAVLVEGYLDAVRAHLAGFSYTVASLGTAVTSRQLQALTRLTETVILALDPDVAGVAAAARTSLSSLAEVTRQRGRTSGAAAALELRIARLPEGRGDPDELIRDHPEQWEQALAGSVPAFEFYFTQTIALLDRSSDRWRQDAIDQLLPVIQQFAGSAGWQATWLERLAAETGIDPRALQRSLPAGRPGRRRPQPSTASEQGREVVSGTTARALVSDPAQVVERALMALLLKLVLVPPDVAEVLGRADLDSADHRAMLQRLLDWQQTGNYDYQMLRARFPAEVRERADELRSLGPPLRDDGKVGVAIAFHLARVRHFRLQAQYARASQLLPDLDAEDRRAARQTLNRLAQEINEVERELDRLSRLVAQSAAMATAQGTIDQDSGSW